MSNEKMGMYKNYNNYVDDVASAAKKLWFYLRDHSEDIEEDTEDYVKLRRDLQDAYEDLLSQEDYESEIPKWKRKEQV